MRNSKQRVWRNELSIFKGLFAMFCNTRLRECWTRERWTGARVHVRVQTQQAIGHWEKDKERRQAQIEFSEREGKWWGSSRSWTRVAVLLISRWQSLYCTWKVKIIFRQIEFDISDEIFLTSFPELTETRSGGRGSMALRADACRSISVPAAARAAASVLIYPWNRPISHLCHQISPHTPYFLV